MDQPTYLAITIKGRESNVKRAAIAANRRINIDTKGFEEKDYVFNEVSFEQQIEDIYGVFGSYELNQISDDLWKFEAEQDSYGCIAENDIKEIAEEISKCSPDVEYHISARITITYDDGYDLCVDIDSVNGEMKVESYEDYYDEEDDDEEE